MAEPRAVNLGKPEEEKTGATLLQAARICGRVGGRILIAGLAQDGRDGEHVAEQMVGEGQRVHAPGQHHAAGIGRRIGRVLHAELAVHVAADVHHHAQQHRQEHHGKDADDADRAPLVAVQSRRPPGEG